MKKDSVVSVVIVTWNSADTIERCLKSIEEVKNKETIVVDNASSDNTTSLIQKHPWVKLIKNKANLGYGPAANQGAKISHGSFIFFLNPDTQVKEGAIEKLSKYALANKDLGVLGVKLLNIDGSIQREVSPFPGVISQILILFRLHRLPFFAKIVYPEYDYNKVQEVGHLMGAAVMVRREAFEKVYGFDENFFLWFEDTDLLRKVTRAGYKIVYFPKAAVKHLRSVSIKKINPLNRQTIWNKSLRYYFRKHKSRLEQLILEPFILLSYLPAFLLLVKEKIKR